jgi:hypothetical protein
MDKLIGSFGEHGLAGLVVGALFMALWFMLREHSKEREQWLEAYKENTEVLRALTGKCGDK